MLTCPCGVQDLAESEDGSCEVIQPPILHLSAEKLNRYGVFLMDYGLVGVATDRRGFPLGRGFPLRVLIEGGSPQETADRRGFPSEGA